MSCSSAFSHLEIHGLLDKRQDVPRRYPELEDGVKAEEERKEDTGLVAFETNLLDLLLGCRHPVDPDVDKISFLAMRLRISAEMGLPAPAAASPQAGRGHGGVSIPLRFPLPPTSGNGC